MVKLFLDGIFEDKSTSPSTVTLCIPKPFSPLSPLAVLRGLILGEPTFSIQNKWGNIINDISNATDISSISGDDSLFSWINASTMCWKGTTPLSLGFEFILINYKKGQLVKNQEEGLKHLIKLASLAPDPKSKVGSAFKVTVHGGYTADILSDNTSVFGNKKSLLSRFRQGPEAISSSITQSSAQNVEGALWVKFGNKITIRNLLLSKIDVTKSTIEVADQNGGNINPLYYRVSVSLIGVRPLVTKEVDNIFGKG